MRKDAVHIGINAANPQAFVSESHHARILSRIFGDGGNHPDEIDAEDVGNLRFVSAC